ncbi:protein kinase [Histoplasma capsulatum var. duboisii H88]|uniref:Protein kinase n=1 Tax=Ajellomyces capsulatus (strain H88) TaxID=544711 RepID=F0UU65_AJEC8|nr:protein kinase [Histoplasma capsulatum var. duboisii H88]
MVGKKVLYEATVSDIIKGERNTPFYNELNQQLSYVPLRFRERVSSVLHCKVDYIEKRKGEGCVARHSQNRQCLGRTAFDVKDNALRAEQRNWVKGHCESAVNRSMVTGISSTDAKEYTSLKVSIQLEDNAQISPILNEVSMLQRLQSFADKDHPGLDFTRLSYDIFQLVSRSGCHYCIASKPQGNSVRTLQETFPNRRLPKLLVKSLIHRLYFSVNWLHATCGVVHTDILPQNVLMQIEDDTSLKDVEDQESQDPSVPITRNNGDVTTIVYRSRPTMLELSGHPILTDFGQMRLVEGCVNQDWWMPDLYRAPEVLLQLPWGFPVDIWSIGVMG